MKNSNPFKILSLLLSAAYFLSACGGTLPQSTTSEKAPEVQANSDDNSNADNSNDDSDDDSDNASNENDS